MVLQEIALYAYNVPFLQPLRLPRAVLTCREGLLVAVTSGDGKRGWGEAAPLPGFSAESLYDALLLSSRIAVTLKGRSLEEARRAVDGVEHGLPSVHFAFQGALDSLAAEEVGIPLHRHVNPASPETLPVCALLNGDTACKRDRACEAIRQGYRTLKLKVGTDTIEREVALVREITGWLAPGCTLRLDANQAWEKEEALRFCRAIPAERIEFLEEPVRDSLDMPAVQEATGIPCAADEALHLLSRQVCRGGSCQGEPATDALREVAAQVRVLVWKPSLCLPLPLLGIRQDRPVVLSGAYETGVGTAAILALAASYPGVCPAVGVDTYTRLAEDILEQPLPLALPEVSLDSIEKARQSVNPANVKLVFHA